MRKKINEKLRNFFIFSIPCSLLNTNIGMESLVFPALVLVLFFITHGICHRSLIGNWKPFFLKSIYEPYSYLAVGLLLFTPYLSLLTVLLYAGLFLCYFYAKKLLGKGSMPKFSDMNLESLAKHFAIMGVFYFFIATILPPDNVLLATTVIFILLIFALSFSILIFSGEITKNVLVINAIQLFLFSVLHYQIYQVLGASHYISNSEPGWYHWLEFTIFHLAKTADLIDLIEAYGIDVIMIQSHGFLSKIVIIINRILVFIFIYEMFKYFKVSVSPDSRMMEYWMKLKKLTFQYRIWILIGAYFGAILAAVQEYRKYLFVGTYNPLTKFTDLELYNHFTLGNIFTWPIENILYTLDVGDILNTFGFTITDLPKNLYTGSLEIIFRYFFASYLFTINWNFFFLFFFQGYGLKVENCIEILSSNKYLNPDKIPAVKALGRFGKKSVPALKQISDLVGTSSAGLAKAVGHTMCKIGTPAIPFLLEKATDESVFVRNAAFEILKKIDPDWLHNDITKSELINIFLMAGSDEDIERRYRAKQLLSEIEPDWRRNSQLQSSALPQIVNNLDSPFPLVKCAALEMIGELENISDVIVYETGKLLTDKDRIVREYALNALERIDPKWFEHKMSKKIIENLLKIICGPNNNVQQKTFALKAVSHYRIYPEKIVPRLFPLIFCKNMDIRNEAIRSMDMVYPEWRRTKAAVKALDKIIRKIIKGNKAEKIKAIEMLGAFGESAKKAEPILLKIREKGCQDLRSAAETTLTFIRTH